MQALIMIIATQYPATLPSQHSSKQDKEHAEAMSMRNQALLNYI